MRAPAQLAVFLAIFSVGGGAGADETRLVSPEISAAILAGLPKFDLKRTAGNGSADGIHQKPGGVDGTAPAFAIVRLPDFVVRGLKELPADDEVLTRKGEEATAMDEYLGDAHGFDRDVLNRFTLTQLWQKIPMLGVLPFVGVRGQVSTRERAMQMYQRAKMNGLKQLVSIGARHGDPAVKKEQGEIDQAREGIDRDPDQK